MTPEQLKTYARRVPEELLTQGDLAVADAVFAPDVVSHGLTEHAAGIAGAKQFVVALRRAFPDLCAIIEDEIAEGDRVVQRLTLSGTHRGAYRGLSPTGRHIIWQLVTIQRLGPNGTIAEYWSSLDVYGLLRQFGALPAADAAMEKPTRA